MVPKHRSQAAACLAGLVLALAARAEDASGLESITVTGRRASATLGWRYLGPRYLKADAGIQSKPALVSNARLEYALTDTVTLGCALLNLTDARYYEAEYFYVSRLPGEPAGGIAGAMVHPGEPLEVRFAVTERF